MKMTKVLGAVLGTLMVAALLTGAVAAHDNNNEESIGDVYIYKLYADDAFTGFLISDETDGWTKEGSNDPIAFAQEVGMPGTYYIAGDENTVGKYSKSIGNKTYTMNLKYPTATVTAVVYQLQSKGDMAKDNATAIANLVGGTANTDNGLGFDVTPFIGGDGVVAGITFTAPDGFTTVNISGDNLGLNESSTPWSLFYYDIKGMDLGDWTVQAMFKKGYENNFSVLAPDYMYGKAYPFTIISADTTKSITASADEVVQGGYVTMAITAPFGDWWVSVDREGDIPANQPGLNDTCRHYVDGTLYTLVHVDTSNHATFVVKSKTTNDMKVSLYKDEGGANLIDHTNENTILNSLNSLTIKSSVTIKVNAGAITATPNKDSVYIGEEIELSGTNDLGGIMYFYIKGTNYPLKLYEGETASGKVWTEVKIDTGDKQMNHPDAGTYTIYIAKLADGVWAENITDTDDFDKDEFVSAYTTVSVGLIQPFITATAQDVVVQTDKLKVEGTAEGNPSNVKIYVFGTNFFRTAEVSVADDGTYSFSKKIDEPNKDSEDIWGMAAGQYFVVVQHKMYDKKYNIGPIAVDGITDVKNSSFKGFNIVLNEHGDYRDLAVNETGAIINKTAGKVIFNTLERQSANAAEALVQAIGSQNIDDMQAHLSFIVAGPTSIVNAIPSQVTKGQALTVSGTTTGHENDMVAVELLSTAFAAVPKETVGSASFTTLTTRVGPDGVWSVTFDTSNMNADDYTVSVAVGQLDAVTAKTKIVDNGPTPTTQPTSEQPTVAPTQATTVAPTSTPSNPGFGALAALIGLGAVAVLLLRRE